MNLSNENIIHVQKGKIEYIQFRKLLEYKDKIAHAYTVGVNVDFTPVGDRKEKAMHEYKDLCDSLKLDVNDLVKPVQNHTKEVKIIENKSDKPEIDKYKETDGVITNKKNIVLATANADCILLFFYDPVKNVIANTHSGWKGTLQRISIETVEKMKSKYGCNPEDIICCMSPSIRKCHFEVDEDVKNSFYEEFKTLKEIDDIIEETKPNKKWHIDTILINRVILKEYGLKDENIIDSGLCSVCNSDNIHSFRAEGEGFGRETAVISLK